MNSLPKVVVFGAGKRVSSSLLPAIRANFSDKDILVVRKSTKPLEGIRTLNVDSMRHGVLANVEHVFICVPFRQVVEVFGKLAGLNPAANIFIDTPVSERLIDSHPFLSGFDVRVLEESSAIRTIPLIPNLLKQKKCVLAWRCLYLEHGLYFLMAQVFRERGFRLGIYIRGLLLVALLPDGSFLFWFMPKSQKGWLRIRARGVQTPNLLKLLDGQLESADSGSIQGPKQLALERYLKMLSRGSNQFPKYESFLDVQKFLRDRRVRVLRGTTFPGLTFSSRGM